MSTAPSSWPLLGRRDCVSGSGRRACAHRGTGPHRQRPRRLRRCARSQPGRLARRPACRGGRRPAPRPRRRRVVGRARRRAALGRRRIPRGHASGRGRVVSVTTGSARGAAMFHLVRARSSEVWPVLAAHASRRRSSSPRSRPRRGAATNAQPSGPNRVPERRDRGRRGRRTLDAVRSRRAVRRARRRLARAAGARLSPATIAPCGQRRSSGRDSSRSSRRKDISAARPRR
jgi:hypothetical protein